MSSRVLVLMPTYNEVDNLKTILGRVLAALPTADVLVLDDDSPDGTGALAERIAGGDSRVHVEHRPHRSGLGAAYLAGFGWGLSRDYDLLVEIDADGSHPPERLPLMLETLAERRAGLVVGSRWVPGGSVVNWPWRRELLSRAGNAYVRLLLGIAVHDATAGFRVFSAEALRALDLRTITARGYFFQVEMTLRVLDAGLDVVEVPIEFREREVGESKMSGSIVREAMLRVTALGLRRAWSRLRTRQAPGSG